MAKALPRRRRRLVARGTLVVLVVGAVLVGALFVAYDVVDRGHGMLIAGRRGDVAEWPENTLSGVRSARDLGAEGIEFDLRRSADGTFYLMHDPAVDRTTDGVGPIAELHDREIDGLRIEGGLGYSGQLDLRVPTLEAVLDELAGYEGLLLLDAKEGPDAHAELARLVMERGLSQHAWIGCYSREQTEAVRSVGAIVTYGGILAGADLLMTSSPLGPLDVLLSPAITAIDQWWTRSEAEPLALAWRLGVRVYITNELANSLAWARARRGADVGGACGVTSRCRGG